MEKVLVVKSELIEPYLKGEFISANTEEILTLVRENYEFINRSAAEENINYKQIIPYIVIKKDEKILLLKRRKAQTEKRLHGLLSLGAGGHINPIDCESSEDVLMHGLLRELNEEVDVENIISMHFCGIINDHSSEVSNYHLGLCYVLVADGNVRVLETEKMEGSFVEVSSLLDMSENIETWSKILLNANIF